MPALSLPALMQLRAFVRVAEHGSISRACEYLLRAQSVITRSILNLEKRLDVTLFERHANGMLLSPYGKAILPRALRILAELDSIPALVGHAPHEPLYLLQTRRLEVFVKLCETRHMQTVAQAFNLTQPAISASLKILEEGASKVLFERTARGLQPTQASYDILYPVRRALNDLRRLDADVAAIKGSLQGVVMVGALPLGRTRILPEAIVQLLEKHPGVRVATNESPFDLLALELRAGDVDFVFGALRADDYASDLQGEELLTEEMVILARNGHPLLAKRLQKEDLKGMSWVLPRADTPARLLLEAHFQRIGQPPPEPVVETGDMAIIRGMLMRSDMLAVVSAHQLEYEIASGELQALTLDLQDTQRPIGLTYRINGLPSPAAEALMTLIREVTGAKSYACR
ncbi:LysR family transcriptional regulator [Pseudomonas endophytica]|uniref:LysR family transcriptional regulator n=1 Tax=Pseudomonas endophytica TaxID=1563157 RepID=A0A0Q1CGV7_9PSED|nr:LysR family transcriptional regulator [Pseudomonas endophytica]KQB53882.1 LysR family transcriptional regulator [Pseudomonas endophytica]